MRTFRQASRRIMGIQTGRQEVVQTSKLEGILKGKQKDIQASKRKVRNTIKRTCR